METVELEEFNQNSSKIPAVQIISLIFIGFQFFILLFKYAISFSFFQILIPKQRKQESYFHNYTKYSQYRPLALIDFHTSRSTFYRIDYLYENYWRNNFFLKSNLFKIRIIYSNLFIPNSHFINYSTKDNIHFKPVDCFDTIFALTCRVDSSYKSFLDDSKYENIGWLYRATDDSYINFENLYHYIKNLSKKFDPMNDLVIRAHANFEMKSNYYIHGGPGYLMSREYVNYHFLSNLTLSSLQNYSKYKQDDTAESIIVRNIFSKSSKQWDEFYIDGFQCKNCDLIKDPKSIFPKCPPDKRIGALSNIISIHLFGLRNQQKTFLSLIKNLSRYKKLYNTRFYNDDNTQSLFLCKSKYGKIEEFNIDRHKKIKVSQLKNPLINFKKLIPESLYSYLFEK